MTISTGPTRTGRLADRGRTMHVLLEDDQGRLRLQRLRPWHPMLARFLAARLDRELADGTSPEASARLAAQLAEPGPVPVQGVAMVSRLLADGTGPLYRQACRDDLAAIIEQATRALTV